MTTRRNRPLIAWARRPDRERAVPCQRPKDRSCEGGTYLNGGVCATCLARPFWRRHPAA